MTNINETQINTTEILNNIDRSLNLLEEMCPMKQSLLIRVPCEVHKQLVFKAETL
jgi:hypothetical protein